MEQTATRTEAEPAESDGSASADSARVTGEWRPDESLPWWLEATVRQLPRGVRPIGRDVAAELARDGGEWLGVVAEGTCAGIRGAGTRLVEFADRAELSGAPSPKQRIAGPARRIGRRLEQVEPAGLSRAVEGWVERRPLLAVGTGAVAGWLLGRVLRP